MFVCALKQSDKHKWYKYMHSFATCFVLLWVFVKWSMFQCIVLVHSFSLLHFDIWLHLSLLICSPSDGHLGGYPEIF